VSDFFETRFPGVREMLEDDADRRIAQADPTTFKVICLELGRPVPESEWPNAEQALTRLGELTKTCAPFVKSALWVEDPNGNVLARGTDL
jgi:hypothetical protein